MYAVTCEYSDSIIGTLLSVDASLPESAKLRSLDRVVASLVEPYRAVFGVDFGHRAEEYITRYSESSLALIECCTPNVCAVRSAHGWIELPEVAKAIDATFASFLAAQSKRVLQDNPATDSEEKVQSALQGLYSVSNRTVRRCRIY